MKVELATEEMFVPVEVVVTIDTLDEFIAMYQLGNHGQKVINCLYDDLSIDQKAGLKEFIHVLYDVLEKVRVVRHIPTPS